MKDSENTARVWLHQSEDDLVSARVLLEASRYAMTCFASQQVAEKTLKALAYYRGDRYVIGHSLTNLANDLTESYPQLLDHMLAIRRLTLYYIPTRYPDALAGGAPSDCFDREQAEEAVGFAAELVAFARSIIPV